MLGALLRRLLQGAVVAVLVAAIAFFMLHAAPGDPLTALVENPSVPPAVIAAERARLGYDRPASVQFARYVAAAARGDLGYSPSLGVPVARAIRAALPNTILLMGTALLLSFAIGMGLGLLQAYRAGSAFDRAASMVSLVFHSLPEFWLALVLLIVLSGRLHLFPGGGVQTLAVAHASWWSWLADRLHHLALPLTTLVLLTTAGVARFQRAAMLEVLPEEYIRTAVARGVSPRSVLLRHAWRNALLPVITLAGVAVPALVGGAVFVEQVFSWPGMGRLIVSSMERRDYALLTGCMLVGGVMVAAGSLVADMLSLAADPRQRPAD